MKKIHVGFLLSFDYEKLKLSIPPVYQYSDRIFLAEDVNRNTWAGNKFDVDDSFYDWLKEFDIDNKIEIFKENFYVPELTGIQMDTRERHMLSMHMGIGNWLIQVDSDEYFIDFEKFVKSLRKYDNFLDQPVSNPIQISGYHIDIYKYIEDGLLYVKNRSKVLLATNYPNYKCARQSRERIIYVDSFTLHESLSRTEEELVYKLNNWSHKHDVNDTFLEKWKSANKENYKTIKDVFYMDASQWKELGYLPTKNFKEMQKYFDEDPNLQVTKTYLFFKNFGQWFKRTKVMKGFKKPKFESYF